MERYETQDCGTYWKVIGHNGKLTVAFCVNKEQCATREEAVAFVEGENGNGKN